MRIARAVTLPAGVASSAHSRGAAWLWSGPAVLAAAAALLMLAAPPRGDFPIEDDWLYGRSVKALVEQGKLELPVMSAAAFAAQAYWGALFARAFGFSLNVLRVSTLVLSASGVLACFLLLRDLTTPKQALVGALLLLFNPLYVFLSYSFMTDVPLVSLSLWSLVCYVRAL